MVKSKSKSKIGMGGVKCFIWHYAMMMKCFLESAQEMIERFLKKYEIKAKIYIFKSVDALEEYLKYEENRLELLFLDIRLDGENGICVAKKIIEQRLNCRIAFVTNYLSYVSDVYAVKHFYYVVKSKFEAYLPEIFGIFMQDERWRLVVPMKGKTLFFQFQDICYVESGRRKSKIVTYKDEEVVSMNFEQVCTNLNNVCFTRCHHSFLVNFNAVKVWKKDRFQLKNGQIIGISRTHREQVEKDFLRWMRMWL